MRKLTSQINQLLQNAATFAGAHWYRPETLEKGMSGDWSKEGYVISHEKHPDHLHVMAHKDGQLVGEARIKTKGKTSKADYVQVDKNHRRKGLATAMYQRAESVTGTKMASSGDTTDAGQSLWTGTRSYPKPFGKSEELEKGMNGDWQKEGYTLSHKKFDKDAPNKHYVTVLARDKNKQKVGEYHFSYPKAGGDILPEDSFTHEAHRRKGLATGAYQYIERLSGRKLNPDIDYQSEDAEELWRNKGNRFGKTLNKALVLPTEAAESVASGLNYIQPLRSVRVKSEEAGLHPVTKQPLYYHVFKQQPYPGETKYTHTLSTDPEGRRGIGAIELSHVSTADSPSIERSGVKKEHRGIGLGKLLYQKVLEHHGKIKSDYSLSPSANAIWNKLGNAVGVSVKHGKEGTMEPHEAIMQKDLKSTVGKIATAGTLAAGLLSGNAKGNIIENHLGHQKINARAEQLGMVTPDSNGLKIKHFISDVTGNHKIEFHGADNVGHGKINKPIFSFKMSPNGEVMTGSGKWDSSVSPESQKGLKPTFDNYIKASSHVIQHPNYKVTTLGKSEELQKDAKVIQMERKIPTHMTHLMNGLKIHSDGHSKKSATEVAKKLRSEGNHSSIWKDIKKPEHSNYIVAVPTETLQKDVGRIKFNLPNDKHEFTKIPDRPDQQVKNVQTPKQVELGLRQAVAPDKKAFSNNTTNASIKMAHTSLNPEKEQHPRGVFVPSVLGTGKAMSLGEHSPVTAEHEGLHYLMGQIRGRHGKEAGDRFVNSALAMVHPDDLQTLGSMLRPHYQDDDYLPEEKLAHVRDVLTDKNARKAFEDWHLTGHMTDPRIGLNRLKASWKAIRGMAKEVKAEHLNNEDKMRELANKHMPVYR